MASKINRITEAPLGFFYHPEFLTESEAEDLMPKFTSLPFRNFEMNGYIGKRLVCSFGYRYSYESKTLAQADPLPEWILPIRDRCAALASIAPEQFVQVLISQYPAGAVIGWHRDKSQFGPTVVGLSFRTKAVMRLRLTLQNEIKIYKKALEPRSAYVLSDEARSRWEHSLNPADALRYSITFRTLRAKS